MGFAEHLRNLHVNEEVIEKIMSSPYKKHHLEKQNNANFYQAVLRKSEELLNDETLNSVMFDRSCCKSGFRLKNAISFAKEYAEKSLEEKVPLITNLKYMGKPILSNNIIETIAVGSFEYQDMKCPCTHLGGYLPEEGVMPLAYCKCCAGHFQFHYQKALKVNLKLLEVVSSILNSKGKKPCIFRYQIIK